MQDSPERRIGTVITGKWRVDALLGSGSMAAVYAVTHRNGARAALKILHPLFSGDEVVCERFLGEAYLTNAVKHPGIVRVIDDGVTDDGCVYLVMDLLEGRTLDTWADERGGKLPLSDVLAVAERLLDVLGAVHDAGIVHRDLKPQNVFVGDDGLVRLLDFGVARFYDGSTLNAGSLVGLVLGTPSFMSPEQALGDRDKVDPRSDVWSVGATLFQVLTGEPVHRAPHVQARLVAAATQPARSIALVMPDLPRSIASVIDVALRFERDERWATARAFREALRMCVAGLIEVPSAPSANPDTSVFEADDAAPSAAALATNAAAPHTSDVRASLKEHVVRAAAWTALAGTLIAVFLRFVASLDELGSGSAPRSSASELSAPRSSVSRPTTPRPTTPQIDVRLRAHADRQ